MVVLYILIGISLDLVSCQGLSPGIDKNPCSQTRQNGNCKAYFPSFYFEQSTGQCDCFVYTGCGGNENRFNMIEDCMQSCGVREQQQKISETCRNIFQGDEILDLLLSKYDKVKVPDIENVSNIDKVPDIDRFPDIDIRQNPIDDFRAFIKDRPKVLPPPSPPPPPELGLPSPPKIYQDTKSSVPSFFQPARHNWQKLT